MGLPPQTQTTQNNERQERPACKRAKSKRADSGNLKSIATNKPYRN